MDDSGKTQQDLLDEVSRLNGHASEPEGVSTGPDSEGKAPPSFDGPLEDFIELSVEGICIVQDGLFEIAAFGSRTSSAVVLGIGSSAHSTRGKTQRRSSNRTSTSSSPASTRICGFSSGYFPSSSVAWAVCPSCQ